MSDDLTRCPCCEGEGYFYGDDKPPNPWGDADELARLRAEVERLQAQSYRLERWLRSNMQEKTANLARAVRAEAALSDERAHADVMEAALAEAASELRDYSPDHPSVRQIYSALDAHRARRQG